MNFGNTVFASLFFLSLCAAQTVVGLTSADTGTTLNQQFLAQRQGDRSSTSVQPRVVVFTGDRVIPQFVDGGSWKTSIFLVNLENHTTSFQVLFFKDDGTDLIVPVVGQGPVRGMDITLTSAGSVEFETTGFSANLAQGWALLSQSTNDSVGGMAIFRQSVLGRPDQEAVVPIVNQFENHFVLLYDNTAFTTAIALANPTLNSVVIPVNIRNQSGQIIDQRTTSLGPYSHTAFTLPDTWISTAGQRGAIEFQTSGFGVGALGLRFSGAAFTSFHVLQNFCWAVPSC
jgi:hypothetical protein